MNKEEALKRIASLDHLVDAVKAQLTVLKKGLLDCGDPNNPARKGNDKVSKALAKRQKNRMQKSH